MQTVEALRRAIVLAYVFEAILNQPFAVLTTSSDWEMLGLLIPFGFQNMYSYDTRAICLS